MSAVKKNKAWKNWAGQFLKNWSALSFAKLRASYAAVGNDTSPDQVLNQYVVGTAFGTPVYSYNTTAKNSNLKSERTKASEAGVNLQFFKNRIGVDVAFFRNDTENQLLALPVTYTSGVAAKFQNVGNMRSEGIEATLNLVPVKTSKFTWEMDVNWSNPKSKVLELASGVQNVTLGSFQGGVTINAALGEDYGTIKGSDFVYDPNGNKVISGSELHKENI